MRIDGRAADKIRVVNITPSVNRYAEGSAEVSFGNTRLLVTATLEQGLPKWKEPSSGGWITAEYGMLPRSTHQRNSREAVLGKQAGRTVEIQRLIGRALRASLDLKKLGDMTIKIDCDVLCADGGTRTAAISGAYIAVAEAIELGIKKGIVSSQVKLDPIAAVSVGLVEGKVLLDLCYEEDAKADFDLNLIFNSDYSLIEIQGTAERSPLNKEKLFELIVIGQKGCEVIFKEQKRALNYIAPRF